MPDPGPSGDTATPGYADALAELEAILADLEDDGIDIDLLAEKVARATTLIRLCRDRISSARVQVDRIVADLEDLTAAEPEDEPGTLL
ncbi:MAG TPA: exodeoxyribonuclease VII small subunit [Acidimicrobiales bacterium]|jgi:exodeoxyribonuclease VII small subunit|nr:exodeoxyribonuclease VII small subunit [Acidimicrobiales bacterium]